MLCLCRDAFIKATYNKCIKPRGFSPTQHKKHWITSFLPLPCLFCEASVFLFYFSVGQSDLVQFLHSLSAFVSSNRRQGCGTVQSARQRPLHLQCHTGDQRGRWQGQLQVLGPHTEIRTLELHNTGISEFNWIYKIAKISFISFKLWKENQALWCMLNTHAHTHINTYFMCFSSAQVCWHDRLLVVVSSCKTLMYSCNTVLSDCYCSSIKSIKRKAYQCSKTIFPFSQAIMYRVFHRWVFIFSSPLK